MPPEKPLFTPGESLYFIKPETGNYCLSTVKTCEFDKGCKIWRYYLTGSDYSFTRHELCHHWDYVKYLRNDER